MKKRILYLILLFCLIGRVTAQEKPEKEIDVLKQKVISLEKTVAEQKIALDAVDKLYDKRFADFYVWFGIFVLIISGALTLTYINASNKAEKEARDEIKAYKMDFDTMKSAYGKQFDEMKDKYEKIVEDVATLQDGFK